MRRSMLPTAIAVFVLLPGAAGAQGLGQPMDLNRRMLMTPKEAIGVMPAELVCEPIIERTAFSASGRYLLIQRQALRLSSEILSQLLAGRRPPPVETSILLWDARTRETRTLWKATGANTRVTSLEWVPGTEVALALAYEETPVILKTGATTPQPAPPDRRQTLLRITPGMSRAEVLLRTSEADGDNLFLYVSPFKPLALLRHMSQPRDPATGAPAPRPQQTLAVIGPDGRLARAYPSAPDFWLHSVYWDTAGSPVLLGVNPKTPEKPARQRMLAFDPKSGTAAPLDRLPPPADPQPRRFDTNAALAVRLKQTGTTAKEGETSIPVAILWLESVEPTEAPRVLVSADTTGGQFAPNGESILFQSQGSLLAAPLVRIDKAVMLAAQEQARRMVLMSNGKQVGLAAMMYAQDHDETLPGPDGIEGKLNPYVGNPSIFQGLNYTFGGGPLKDVEKPAETELGFIPGAGGRAVIYVDGHVKWRADK